VEAGPRLERKTWKGCTFFDCLSIPFLIHIDCTSGQGTPIPGINLDRANGFIFHCICAPLRCRISISCFWDRSLLCSCTKLQFVLRPWPTRTENLLHCLSSVLMKSLISSSVEGIETPEAFWNSTPALSPSLLLSCQKRRHEFCLCQPFRRTAI
jgi:hypothetical protein